MGRTRNRLQHFRGISGLRSGVLGLGLLALMIVGVASRPAGAIGTEFTYQGRLLNSDGDPVTGTYDFQFFLYSVAEEGSAIATDVNTAVSVVDGLFSTDVDFGAGAFDGSSRWLKIDVRETGQTPWVPGDARQKINPTPYSMIADTVDGIHASSTPTANTLLPLDANAKVPDAALPASATADNHSLDAADGSPTDAVYVDDEGRVGVGTSSPLANLDVAGFETDGTGTAIAVQATIGVPGDYDNYGLYSMLTNLGSDSGTAVYGFTGGATNGNTGVSGTAVGTGGASAYGVIGNANGTDGSHIGLYGTASGSNATNYGVRASASGGTTNYAGYFDAGNVYMGGNVGIGDTTPTGKFQVAGDAVRIGADTGTAVNYATGDGDLYVKDAVEVDGTTYLGGNVGIGVSPTGKLQVTGDEVRIGAAGTVDSATGDGDLYVQDALEVDGPVYLGDNALDLITVNGYIELVNEVRAIGVDQTDPAFTALNDDNTGIFFPAADTLGVTTGGTERIRVGSTGRVGIGTSPSAYMTVQVHNPGTGATDYASIQFTTGDTGSAISDGLAIGYAPNNESLIWNSENTRMLFGTNNTARAAIQADGPLVLFSSVSTDPSAVAGEAKFYCKNGEMWVKGQGSPTQLSSHAAPRDYVPEATQTSFDDLSVSIPWSFHHGNDFLGMGQVVDIAKAMQWVEQKMQQEKGKDGGKLFYNYRLAKTESVDDYIESSLMSQVESILASRPIIEVELGADGSLPADAWEEVEILETQETEETVVEHEIDWNTAKVVAVQKTKKTQKQVSTGRRERRLKSNYRLDEAGKLLRERTIDDIDSKDLTIPTLPDWILDRVPDGRKALSEWKSSDAKVKQVLAKAAKEKAGKTPETGVAETKPQEKTGTQPVENSKAAPSTAPAVLGPAASSAVSTERLPGGGG